MKRNPIPSTAVAALLAGLLPATASACLTCCAPAILAAGVSAVVERRSDDAPLVVVEIFAFQYRPAEWVIPVGASVRWINLDSAEHTVTSTSTPVLFDSGLFGLNQTYERSFSQAGVFPYDCDVHGDMIGSVDVRRLGDADGDGWVGLGDFSILGANFNRTGQTYATGDFNLDGRADLADFGALASNFNTSGTVARPAAVPEPASAALCVAAVSLPFMRRRSASTGRQP